MAELEESSSGPEIKADEDWKAHVKTEDARLDAERTRQASEQGATASKDSPPFDPARFPQPSIGTLIGLFSTQAMVSLGLLGHPEDGKREVQLPLARHFIDLLGVVEDKTRGNLTESEGKLLEQSLHDLRMAYLERTRAQ